MRAASAQGRPISTLQEKRLHIVAPKTLATGQSFATPPKAPSWAAQGTPALGHSALSFLGQGEPPVLQASRCKEQASQLSAGFTNPPLTQLRVLKVGSSLYAGK